MPGEVSCLSPWLGSEIFNPELPAKYEGKTFEEAEVTENVIMLNELLTGEPL